MCKMIEPVKKEISLDSGEGVYHFLQQPTIAIAEFLTGLLANESSAYKLSAGKLIQGAVKGKFLSELGKEIKKYREEGRIKEDYFASNKNQLSLLELLKFIDGDVPDEEVFNTMKGIFFMSVMVDSDNAKEMVGYQLMQVCKKLTSLDIMILRTCYGIYQNPAHGYRGITDYHSWEKIVAQEMKFDLPELVGAQDDKLVGLGLLSGRTYADKSGIRKGREFRLTSLSIKLFDYIS